MSINIHGKEYITVAERVKAIHEAEKSFSIITDLINNDPVVVKATVTTPKGTFTGISYANFDKAIEKQSPYEVAETSAVGRALGFAGYGLVDDIASADEMYKAGVRPTYSQVRSSAKKEIKKMTQEIDDLVLDDEMLGGEEETTYCPVCGGHISLREIEYCKSKGIPVACFDCQKGTKIVSQKPALDKAFASERKSK